MRRGSYIRCYPSQMAPIRVGVIYLTVLLGPYRQIVLVCFLYEFAA